MNKLFLLPAMILLTTVAPLAAQTGDAPITTKSATLTQPPAGQGQVVFYRTGSLVGAALGCTIFEGATQVARLGSGKYYAVAATPGKHVYNTRGEAKDELTLEVEAGESVFVRCKIGAGIVAGRANLSPSDRDSFAQKAKGLSLWKGPDDRK